MNIFKKKKESTNDFEQLQKVGEAIEKASPIIEDIAELLKRVIELIHRKREEVFIERYTTGYTFANKNGRVFFRSYEDAKKDLDSLNWEEPEPPKQLNPLEAIALPGQTTNFHL